MRPNVYAARRRGGKAARERTKAPRRRAAAPPDLLDVIASLVEKSLLQREAGNGGASRFRMLETIREYGWERLASSGEEAPSRRAHAAYFLDLAERCERAGWVHFEASLATSFDAELPNLRAALSWLDESDDPACVVQMAGALRWFWSACGHVTEGRMWLERGLERASTMDPPIRARADGLGPVRLLSR
ncbi:MAG: hypothetical protein ACRDJW_13375 [Thermomicrobiales bacterium]